MKKWIKRFWIVIAILLVVAVGATAGVVAYKNRNKDKGQADADVVVKENVKTILADADPADLPVEVTDNQVIFQTNPGYKIGDVIVSDSIEAAENGFIRRVTAIEKDGEQYIFETEPATLTDVFEELHLEKTYRLTEDSVEEVNPEEEQESESAEETAQMRAVKASVGEFLLRDTSGKFEKNYDIDKMYEMSAEVEIEEDGISVSQKAGFSVEIKVDVDIHWGEIQMELLVENVMSYEAGFGYEGDILSTKEFKKSFWKKKLPQIKILAGGVPIIFSNQAELVVSCKVE